MANSFVVKPLGLVLQKAGLVSTKQLRLALKDQKHAPNRKIGEILAIKGWIKPETADFFAEDWPKLIRQRPRKLLGQYFQAAALLNEQEIQTILQEQKLTGLRFGALAVLKGWIGQTTLDFFLEQLELTNIKDTSVKGLFQTQSRESYEIRSISHYLLQNQKCEPGILLKLYQQIWQQEEVLASGSNAEAELIASGLIVKDNNKIKIAKPIYRSVFNQGWIEQELARLQPYSRIRLKLFGLETKASSPYKVLTEVSTWTDNQPFLTQKLYQLIQERQSFIPRGEEARIIEELVQTHIVDHWENQIAAEHLQELSDRLLQNKRCSPIVLLKSYKKIWQQREVVADGTLAQAELLDIGLVKEQQGKITVANRIYQSVFNQSWIEQQLTALTQPQTAKAQSQDQTEIAELIPEKSPPAQSNRRTRIIIAFLALLALSSGALFLANWFARNREIRLFYQGNELLQQQKYDQALEAYNQILKLNSNYYQAWTNRGYALAGLKEYQQMLQSCNTATVIQPQAKYAWNCKGEALHNLQEYEQAFEAFKQASEVDPQESIFWLNQGESLDELQRTDEALAVINRGISLLEKQKKTQGINSVRNYLRVAYYNQGQALFKQQKYAESLNAYQQSLNYQEDYLPAQWGKGIILQRLKRYEEAQNQFDRVLKRPDISDQQRAITWFYKGLNLCEAQNYDAATAALEQALQLNPEYEAAKAALARCS